MPHPGRPAPRPTPGSLKVRITDSYGLALISQREISPKRAKLYYHDPSLGAGTTAYILDSGLTLSHPEFEGRASFGYNALPTRRPDRSPIDSLGHGTHTAGLIGGKTYGVASQARLVAVKVVDAAGGADLARLLDGLQWALRDIVGKKLQGKAVVHVSPHIRSGSAWDQALAAAWAQGVSVVVPAGDSGRDGSGKMAGVARGALVVAAADGRRERLPSATYGAGLTASAPGEKVKSAFGASGTRELTGSAQAAAFVSGLVAYFKGLDAVPTGDAGATRTAIISRSLPHMVAVPKGAKVRFAFNGSGK
ncbi:subtilisin-like protein [Myriangium duriaei CBS 260.36]|uniref:Subtilisin-like protein n=1 Tax=Myriangium duriaei CBS 260.36 TaxID=1168546 RepID=A0A9P4ITM0_9PEZI|nr:subtilisin-like protein [Myriangium duriaei CBS 260.36]